MNIWRKYKINELGKVITGGTPPSKFPLHFGNYIPFITPSDFGNYIKNAYTAKRSISEEGAYANQNKLLPEDSILVTCIGSDMGKVVINKKICLTNQQINSIIPYNDLIDYNFLYYSIINQYDLLRSIASDGTTMPIINKKDFENIEIIVPDDLVEQQRIASILSSLDDKIELNRRMNQTLEQMAQALFNHYFVDNIDPDNLPEGWKLSKLGEHCNIFRGASPRPITDPKYFSHGTIPWIKISDATASASIYINSTKEYCTELAIGKSRFLKKGSLILSNSATIGIPKILNIDGCIHDGWLAFNNLRTLSRNFLFFALTKKLSEFKQIATGSVQDNLNTSLLKETELIIPTRDDVEKFDKDVDPLFEKIRVNDQEIVSLIFIRDTLLPKLMFGEIDVSILNKEELIPEDYVTENILNA